MVKLITVLLAANMLAACAFNKSASVNEPISDSTSLIENEALLLQAEIKRLQELIKKKDAVIRQQQAQQKNQVKEQQEVSSEVARVQTRLHRLATKPSTASTIAEVEVAMERLKQEENVDANHMMQQDAQSLLDTALAFYERNEYVAAMNYASQAHEFINMALDQNRQAIYSERKTVPIYTAIMLKTVTDVNLRQEPHGNAKILGTLNKDAILIANAYRGNWFRVQTVEGRQGWVLNTLVRTVTVNPKQVNGD